MVETKTKKEVKNGSDEMVTYLVSLVGCPELFLAKTKMFKMTIIFSIKIYNTFSTN
jgi:hypothetical protein